MRFKTRRPHEPPGGPCAALSLLLAASAITCDERVPGTRPAGVRPSLEEIRGELPGYVPVPPEFEFGTPATPRTGPEGVWFIVAQVWVDEPFPARKTSRWFAYEAERLGWRPLAHLLEAPQCDAAAGGWYAFGNDPVGLQWSSWWVNERREALAVDIFYHVTKENRIGSRPTVMIRFFPAGPYLAGMVARYEHFHGPIWTDKDAGGATATAPTTSAVFTH